MYIRSGDLAMILFFLGITLAVIYAFANTTDPRPLVGSINCKSQQVTYLSQHPVSIDTSVRMGMNIGKSVDTVLATATALNNLCK